MIDGNGNGHHNNEEDECKGCKLEKKCREAGQRSKCTEEKLRNFSDWMDDHEEEINGLKVDTASVAAYCLSRSDNKIIFLMNPDIMIDIIILMTYAYWLGRTVTEKKKEEKADGKA